MKLSGLLASVALAGTLLAGPAGAQDVIRVGVVGALTGSFAATGQSQLTGAEMKAKELNAAGGKYKIELVSEDDASNCNQSANATVKLITQNKVAAILGAVNSPCALVMVPLTQRYRVPQFTFGVGSAITQQGSEWVFRVAVAAAGQTQALADYAVNTLKKTKIAVLYSDDEYGASMANGFKAALDRMGLKPAAFETFPRADQDFTGQLTTVKASGADAIYPIGSYVAAALIAKQAKQLGLNLQLLGDTGLATPKFIELGGEAVEGAVLVEPFTPADPDPNNQDFVVQVPEGRRVFRNLTVYECLLMGGLCRRDRRAVEQDIEGIYGRFPRLRERSGQLAGTLSGGEQQMLAFGRALVAKPRLLLLDEPSMGLAPTVVAAVADLIRSLRDEGVTVLLVEQNAELALGLADHGYVLETGTITLSGPASDLLGDARVRESYLGI